MRIGHISFVISRNQPVPQDFGNQTTATFRVELQESVWAICDQGPRDAETQRCSHCEELNFVLTCDDITRLARNPQAVHVSPNSCEAVCTLFGDPLSLSLPLHLCRSGRGSGSTIPDRSHRSQIHISATITEQLAHETGFVVRDAYL